jgi:diacylglycerol kinase (ATP)
MPPKKKEQISLYLYPMIYFIYNPNAGSKSPKQRGKIITLLNSVPNSMLLVTSKPLEAIALAQTAINNKAEKIIAVGGDGTINEVATTLIGSNIPLGIIPIGSGNGLARHLNIPLTPVQALQKALQNNNSLIDVGFINERPFFCTAGIGFDAEVAHQFAKQNKRGLINYIKATIITLFRYKPISTNTEGINQQLFSLTIANANQFGNNAFISPLSNIQDGNIEIVKILPLNYWNALLVGIKLFLKKIRNSKNIQVQTITNAIIEYQTGMPMHLDGEAIFTEAAKLNISIRPASLLVCA